MGIIVNDVITLNNGTKIQGAYISFSGKHIHMIPRDSFVPPSRPNPFNTKWVITGTGYNVWLSKEEANAGKPPAGYFPCNIQASDTDVATKPIHQICYEYLKTIYKNTTDC
jgi:hypothetical protein